MKKINVYIVIVYIVGLLHVVFILSRLLQIYKDKTNFEWNDEKN